jgi:hypothetical protein
MFCKRYLLIFVAVIAVMTAGVLTVAAQDDEETSPTSTIVEENTDLFRFVIGGCSSFDAPDGNDITSVAPLTPGDQHRVVSYFGQQTTVGESSIVQIQWVLVRTSEFTSVWVPGSCGTLIFAS